MSYLGRTGKLSQRAYNKLSFLATAGQTVKSGLSYVAGFVEVYVNGTLLTDVVDYSASNGNSVTFIVALSVNDEVTVVSLKTFVAANMLPLSGGTLNGDLDVAGNVTVDGLVVDGATDLNGDLDVSGGAIVDGNLLVGKTAIGAASDGFEARANGFTAMSDTDSAALNVNRNGTDGALQYFYKAGTTVGSIGTYNGVPYYGGSGGGVMFNGSNWNPTNGTATRIDGVADLGASTYRFKNAYLSGGVVFGTGGPSPITSNTLDDYEEGTWTPTVIGGTLTLSTLWSRKYTKIGNLVTIQCFIALNDDGSGGVNAVIGGLPFTVLGNAYGTGVLSHSTGLDTTSTMYVRAEAAYNKLLVYKGSATQVRQDQIDGGWIIFTVSYHTS